MTTTSLSLSPSLRPFLSIFNRKPYCSLTNHSSSLPLTSPTTTILSKRPSLFHNNPPYRITQKSTQIWRISALSEGEVPPPLENSQEIVSTSDDGVSTIISALLFTAFIGLSILTIGIIYIGVTDFLQKREKEKFEKEEATRTKKSGKKKKVRARAGPRGFGQKIDEED